MTTTTTIDSTLPDWSEVSFDVPCRRCGTKLNGTASHACPTCEVPLNWDRLLPVEDLRCLGCGYCVFRSTENRCTECGNEFSWDKVYEAAIASYGRTFERDWYRKPIASFGRTWFQSAFQPRKFWADLSLFDRPNVIALLVVLAAQWLVFYQGWHVVDELAGRYMTALARSINYPARFYYPYRPGRHFMPMVAYWYVGSFVSFGFFFYSLRKGGVTWRHMLRVVIYSFTFASMGMFTWGVAEMVMDWTILFNHAVISSRTYQIPPQCYGHLGTAMLLLVLVAAWAHLWIGIRRHLGLRHGWMVSAACIVLGFLLAQVALAI